MMQHQKIEIADLKSTTTILNKILKLTTTFLFNGELWNKKFKMVRNANDNKIRPFQQIDGK